MVKYDGEEVDRMITNSNIVICEICHLQNLKSIVTESHSTTTMMACPAFFDEEGKRHSHNNNRVITNFKCSNGHSFTKQRINSCWCGWKQDVK